MQTRRLFVEHTALKTPNQRSAGYELVSNPAPPGSLLYCMGRLASQYGKEPGGPGSRLGMSAWESKTDFLKCRLSPRKKRYKDTKKDVMEYIRNFKL